MQSQTLNLLIIFSGQQKELKVLDTITIKDLIKKIQQLFSTKKHLIIKYGYPPTEPKYQDMKINDAGIDNMDRIIAEIDSTRPSMIVREIESNNSCLFSCFSKGYFRTYDPQSIDQQNMQLRQLVASKIDFCDEQSLDRPKKQYKQWIVKSNSWGGSTEINILAKELGIQVFAISIEHLIPFKFGQDGLPVLYVLYDGIHYNLLVGQNDVQQSEMTDLTLLDENYVTEAIEIAQEFKKNKQYVNLDNFKIICGVCKKSFNGQQEAVKHSKETNHLEYHQ
ncbi:aminotransferase [Paramecium bursaria]